MLKAENAMEAFKITQPIEPGSTKTVINVQWKSTDIFADFYCKCGFIGSVDGYFCYSVKCPDCGRMFALTQDVELVEIEDGEASPMLIAE